MSYRPGVLYVDDEPINTKLFEINFNRDYKVFTARVADEGIRLLRLHIEIKVVISDLKMPVMNGIEFIKLAKKEFPEKHYFLLSGLSETDEIISAIQTKLVSSYFLKPFDIPAIKESIAKVLEGGKR